MWIIGEKMTGRTSDAGVNMVTLMDLPKLRGA